MFWLSRHHILHSARRLPSMIKRPFFTLLDASVVPDKGVLAVVILAGFGVIGAFKIL